MPQSHPFTNGTQVSITWNDVNINEVKGAVENTRMNTEFSQYEYKIDIAYDSGHAPPCKIGPVLAEFVTELNP